MKENTVNDFEQLIRKIGEGWGEGGVIKNRNVNNSNAMTIKNTINKKWPSPESEYNQHKEMTISLQGSGLRFSSALICIGSFGD